MHNISIIKTINMIIKSIFILRVNHFGHSTNIYCQKQPIQTIDSGRCLPKKGGN